MAIASLEEQFDGLAPDTTASDNSLLRGRFQILANQPLPQFDSQGRPAYNAVDLHGGSGPLFALICKTDHCPRIDTIPALMRMPKIALVKPIMAGVIYWAPAEARRAVILFEQPWTGRLADSIGDSFPRWREDKVIDSLLKSVAPVLREFADHHVTHRAIRPDNIFSAGAGADLMLGECVSAQPGYFQPSFVEPIESAMAQPSGRGDGKPADDIYALGVLVVYYLSGGNPVADMSDIELTRAKMTKGSYAVLTHKIRASLHIVEVLRGMLCDDPQERWNIDDLEHWLNGRHLSPKQPVLPRKAQRAFSFEGEDYHTARALSYALGRHWEAAVPLARDGSIETWVRRSLSDEALANELVIAKETAQTDSADTSVDDVLLSLVLIALDHSAPLRYKEFSALPDGLHKAYAVDYDDPVKRQCYLDVVQTRIVSFWSRLQPKQNNDHLVTKRGVEAARRMLQRSRRSYGPERALYTMNPGWACQSPMFGNDYVSEPSAILPCLSALAESDDRPYSPVDSHIIAFCAVNHRRMPESVVFGLAKREDGPEYALHVLQLLGEIQRIYGPAKMPQLAKWAASLVEPAIETYHHRDTRAEIQTALDNAVLKGSMVDLLNSVDNLKVRQHDDRGFLAARQRFARYSHQVHWIKVGGMRDPHFVKQIARPISSVATAAMAGIAILFMAIAYVS